jgi:L-fuculose-phosphate aldolase
MSDIGSLKEQMLQGLRIMTREALFEKAYGHISARVGDGHCLMTGHIHGQQRTLDDLGPADILLVDLDGNVEEGELETPGEFPIHTEVYKARPDVGCVVHCHPRAPVTLSIAGKDVLPVNFRGTIFSPRVRTFTDPTQIDDEEKGRAMAEALGNDRAVVLRAHGVVCVGKDVPEAVVTTIDLNEVARFQLEASAIGEPLVVGEEYMRNGVIAGLEDEFFSSAWNYYVARLGKETIR